MRSTFRRGILRVFLEESYRENGIRAGTQIEGPSGTRFIVYSAGYLEQSFRHYRARYLALKRAAVAMSCRQIGRQRLDIRRKAKA